MSYLHHFADHFVKQAAGPPVLSWLKRLGGGFGETTRKGVKATTRPLGKFIGKSMLMGGAVGLPLYAGYKALTWPKRRNPMARQMATRRNVLQQGVPGANQVYRP